MKHTLTAIKLSALALTLFLAACGGGSGGSSDSGTTPTTPVTPAFPVTAKYLGTWKSVCEADSTVLVNNVATKVTYSAVFTTNTENTATGTRVIHAYAVADTTCAGAPVGNLITNLMVSIDAAGAGADASDKVTITVAPHPLQANSLTIGNVKWNDPEHTAGHTGKDLMLISGSIMRFGDHTNYQGPNVYPTAIDYAADGIYTKQ